MTKLHENFIRGSASDVLEKISAMREEHPLKGEITMVIAPSPVRKDLEDLFRESQIDKKSDLKYETNVLEVAHTLNETVDMRVSELTKLLE